jgi:RNA polymerase sigma factor (sigma-70 family)
VLASILDQRALARNSSLFSNQVIPQKPSQMLCRLVIGEAWNRAASGALKSIPNLPILEDLDVSHFESRNAQCDGSIVALVPALRAFARTFHKDCSNADDLVQETLLKALANIDKFEPGTRMKSWLFTIMRNTFYTNIRTYLREAPGADDCVSDRPTMEPTQEWSMRGLEVRDAINRLPQHHREVLVLVGVLGVSYDEAAKICNCAIGTVKSRLNRARAGILQDLCEESPSALLESLGRQTEDKFEADLTRRN